MPSGKHTDSFCTFNHVYVKLRDDFATDKSSDLWPRSSDRGFIIIMQGKEEEFNTQFPQKKKLNICDINELRLIKANNADKKRSTQ